MNDSEKVLADLKSSYEDGRLIPFIGSGFSIPLGLPDWRTLLGNMAEKVGYERDLFFLHGSYAQLLEYLKFYHPYEWKEFLYSMNLEFNSPDSVVKRKASATHQALAELSFKTIYTTNYDMHVEEALKDKNKRVSVLSNLSDFVRPLEKNIDCEIIKFHGTLRDESRLILTETQYFDRMELEEPVDQRLRSDLLSNSFLFIGYSFSDTNIRYIWYKIHKLKSQQKKDFDFELRPSFYVTFGYEPVQYKLLEKWDIKVVALDPSNINQNLADFLASIK